MLATAQYVAGDYQGISLEIPYNYEPLCMILCIAMSQLYSLRSPSNSSIRLL